MFLYRFHLALKTSKTKKENEAFEEGEILMAIQGI
jgi:hypothetical protein